MITTREVPLVGTVEGVGVGVAVGVGDGVGVGVLIAVGVGVGVGATEIRGATDVVAVGVGVGVGVVGADMRGVTETTGLGAMVVALGAILGATTLAPTLELVPYLVPRFGTMVALGATSASDSEAVVAPRNGRMAPTFPTTK